MRIHSNHRQALVLTALGAWLALQGGAVAQQPTQARPKEAAVVVTPREFVLPVSGLSAENSVALREDLLALSNQVYACQACKVEQASEGTCPKCQAALKPETRALLGAVQPSPQDGRIQLTLEPHASVRVSRLEAVLAKREVKIDDERFALPGLAQLIVRVPSPVQPAVVQTALEEAKLFESVKAEADTAPNQVVATVRAGARAPTRAKVSAALSGAKAQLADVLLLPPPAKP